MHRPLIALLALNLGLASAESIWVTPHMQYSSSVGVPGCLIDTNRVAYFPQPVSCTEPCMRMTNTALNIEVVLLHIDTSGGANDISYDAWNRLQTGVETITRPLMGGGIPVEMERLKLEDPECKALLGQTGGKIPTLAANPGFSDCPEVAQYRNYRDMQCKQGTGEICDKPGLLTCLNGEAGWMKDNPVDAWVKNIEYGTGESIPAE